MARVIDFNAPDVNERIDTSDTDRGSASERRDRETLNRLATSTEAVKGKSRTSRTKVRSQYFDALGERLPSGKKLAFKGVKSLSAPPFSLVSGATSLLTDYIRASGKSKQQVKADLIAEGVDPDEADSVVEASIQRNPDITQREPERITASDRREGQAELKEKSLGSGGGGGDGNGGAKLLASIFAGFADSAIFSDLFSGFSGGSEVATTTETGGSTVADAAGFGGFGEGLDSGGVTDVASVTDGAGSEGGGFFQKAFGGQEGDNLMKNPNFLKFLAQVGGNLDPQGAGGAIGQPTVAAIESKSGGAAAAKQGAVDQANMEALIKAFTNIAKGGDLGGAEPSELGTLSDSAVTPVTVAPENQASDTETALDAFIGGL